MRKLVFLHICETKWADQLRCNFTADQRLCFGYIVQLLYFLYPKFQASNHLWLYNSVCVRPRQELLATQLKSKCYNTIVIKKPEYLRCVTAGHFIDTLLIQWIVSFDNETVQINTKVSTFK